MNPDLEIENLIRETSHAMATEIGRVLEQQQRINAQLLRLVERLVERQDAADLNIAQLERLCSALGHAIDPALPPHRLN